MKRMNLLSYLTAIALLPALLMAQQHHDGGGWACPLTGMMSGGWPMILFWALVIIVVVWVVGRVTGTGKPSPEGETDARATLDRRYASGELSREQYEQMKKDLES